MNDEAELIGPNDEFLVVSSYSLEEGSNEDQLIAFTTNIANAMREAANEPDLKVTSKLTKAIAENGLPIWSVLSESSDQSHFFDQYAVVRDTTAVVVTIEGNFVDKSSSAEVEEAVHSMASSDNSNFE